MGRCIFIFYRGNWHGQVAVKVIEIKEPTAIQLQAFKMQVCRSLDTMKEALVRKYNWKTFDASCMQDGITYCLILFRIAYRCIIYLFFTFLFSIGFQVQTFRKTRHENLVLFMGACMEPPKLAIITRFE